MTVAAPGPTLAVEGLAKSFGAVRAVELLEHLQQVLQPKQENAELIERGIFVQQEAPEYCEEYQKVVERAMKGRS